LGDVFNNLVKNILKIHISLYKEENLYNL